MSDRYSSNATRQNGRVSNFESFQASASLKPQADRLLNISSDQMKVPHDEKGDQKPKAKMLLTEFASFGADLNSQSKKPQKTKKSEQNLNKKTFDYSSRKQAKPIVITKDTSSKDVNNFIDNDLNLNLRSSDRLNESNLKNHTSKHKLGEEISVFRDNVNFNERKFGSNQKKRARSQKESPQRLLNNKLLVFNSSSQVSEHFKIMYHIQMKQKEPNLAERRSSDVPSTTKSSITYFPSASPFRRRNIKVIASQENLEVGITNIDYPHKKSEAANITHEGAVRGSNTNRVVKPISFPLFNKTFNQEKNYKLRTLMNKNDQTVQLPKIGETLRNQSAIIDLDSVDVSTNNILKYNDSKRKDQEVLTENKMESERKAARNVSFSQRRNSDMMFGDSHFNIENASYRINHENIQKFLVPSGSSEKPNLEPTRQGRHLKVANRTRSKRKELEHALDLISTQEQSMNTSKKIPYPVKQKNYLSFLSQVEPKKTDFKLYENEEDEEHNFIKRF